MDTIWLLTKWENIYAKHSKPQYVSSKLVFSVCFFFWNFELKVFVLINKKYIFLIFFWRMNLKLYKKILLKFQDLSIKTQCLILICALQRISMFKLRLRLKVNGAKKNCCVWYLISFNTGCTRIRSRCIAEDRPTVHMPARVRFETSSQRSAV